MSSVPDNRDSNTANAACTTMNSDRIVRSRATSIDRGMQVADRSRTGASHPGCDADRRPRTIGRQIELRRATPPALRPSRRSAATSTTPDRPPNRAPRAATARSPRTAPAAASHDGRSPAARAAYATITSRVSGPIDKPSAAMWCTTTTSTCSVSADSEQLRAHRDLARSRRTARATELGNARATSSSATGSAVRSRRDLGAARAPAGTRHRRPPDRPSAAISCRPITSTTAASQRIDIERRRTAGSPSGCC